jgi:hypothetical protein
MKNTKRGCSTCKQQKSERIVESFEEFTSKQDMMGSPLVNTEVDVLAMDMLASLEDVGMFPNEYGDNELRLVFKDGSYIYLFFAIPLRDQTNLRSSKLRMFNTRDNDGLANEFMGEIRNIMRNGDFPYSTIEMVIKEFGKEFRMPQKHVPTGEIQKEVEVVLNSMNYTIKDYKLGIAYQIDDPKREIRIGKLLNKYLQSNPIDHRTHYNTILDRFNSDVDRIN